jgi:hypothetical protein
MGFSLGYVLLAAEAYFYLDVEPDGFAFTLASKRWHHLYDGPINSLGFRDDEHRPKDFVGKRTVMVLGDSFAAGSGITDYRKRFSSVLASKLGNEWTVVNVSRGGWDITHEHRALEGYPYQPEIVILQYYINDINRAGLDHGVRIVPPIPEPRWWLKPIVTHSYVADFFYWRLLRSHLANFLGEFEKRIRTCYADDAMWRDHEGALRAFVECARRKNIKLLVLIIPDLFQVDAYKAITARVAAVFTSMGVEVLDLAPLLAGRNPMTMVCNAFNGHANEALSQEIGTLLYERLTAPPFTNRPWQADAARPGPIPSAGPGSVDHGGNVPKGRVAPALIAGGEDEASPYRRRSPENDVKERKY